MSTGVPLFCNSNSAISAGGKIKKIVEFRAGRMVFNGRMVEPDKRKGIVFVYKSEDSLIHFCWKDRTTGIVEEDLIVFPDDCEYVRVEQCTTGRVYVLKFKATTRKLFFWMQVSANIWNI